MTTVKFTMEGSRITGFTSEGHSGYGEAGEDIVCAAVSSTIGLVECACNTVLGIAASVRIDEKKARISLHLPGGLSPEDEHTCQTLLASLMVYIVELQEEYPDYITVMEV
ncbi:MAG: ribosomal-processing cysteine protease Prp [Oscillospiraceae bacterium]|nr:ribosomal-processing cysteine protease Prp [Oscillospiraceae bacterium]